MQLTYYIGDDIRPSVLTTGDRAIVMGMLVADGADSRVGPFILGQGMIEREVLRQVARENDIRVVVGIGDAAEDITEEFIAA